MSHPFFRDFSRRDFVKFSLAGALGVSYSGWLPRLARAAAESPAAKPKACILLWMSGGPSQMDTFDLKPGHANGGTFKETQSAVPGIKISEHLPGVASQMKDLAIVCNHGLDHGQMHFRVRPGFDLQRRLPQCY